MTEHILGHWEAERSQSNHNSPEWRIYQSLVVFENHLHSVGFGCYRLVLETSKSANQTSSSFGKDDFILGVYN